LREPDGRPVDALHVHGYAQPEEARLVAKSIWDQLDLDTPPPPNLGRHGEGTSQPLAITQLLLLFHMLDIARDQD
jgi:phosphoribulokinase